MCFMITFHEVNHGIDVHLKELYDSYTMITKIKKKDRHEDKGKEKLYILFIIQ